MKSVGIIPNPASGKDIRRLVVYGSDFDNHEKVNIVDSSFDYLDAPIKTVAAGNTIIPFSPLLEDAMLPSEEKIIAAVKSVAG